MNIFEDWPAEEEGEEGIDWKRVFLAIIMAVLVIGGIYELVVVPAGNIITTTGPNQTTEHTGNSLIVINGQCILPAVNDTTTNPVCGNATLVGIVDPVYGCYGPFSEFSVTKPSNFTLAFDVTDNPPLHILAVLQNINTHKWILNPPVGNFNAVSIPPASYTLQPGQYRFGIFNCNHVKVTATIIVKIEQP